MVTDMEDVHKEMSTDYSNGVVSGYTKKQLDISNDSIQTMIYVSTWRISNTDSCFLIHYITAEVGECLENQIGKGPATARYLKFETWVFLN